MSPIATRRERVVLDLEDNLTPGLLRAAAAAELLDRRVNSMSKSAVHSRAANRDMAAGMTDVERSASRAEKSLDKYTGRLGLLADAAITLGPALVPIGAVGIPAISGLASSFGFAAVGAGTALAAFQGVSAALKAMNKANLEPTTANLQAAQKAMDGLSPSAQAFVKQLGTMIPELKRLRDAAAGGMFPGLTEGLASLETVFPKIQRIMGAVGGELGSIGADAGKSLASPRWASFFTFLEKEAPKALHDMATAIGNVAHAAAQMWMAFAPLNQDFSAWMVKATGNLDKWATGLSKTQGFAEFIDYVQKSGPQVGAALAAIGNALVQIVTAAAPIGGPVLQAITAFANAVANIAGSDLGTPIMAAVIAMRLFSRAAQVASSSTEGAFGKQALGNLRSQVVGFKGISAAYREVRAASEGLTRAEQARASAAVRARDTQFGLVGTGAKRDSVSQFVAASKAQEEAAKRVATAERTKSAALREGAAFAGKAVAGMAALTLASSGLGDKMRLANTATLALGGSFFGPPGIALGAGVGLMLDLAHGGDASANAITSLNSAIRSAEIPKLTTDLAAVNKELADSKHITSFGDAIGDIGRQIKQTFSGDPLGHGLADAAKRGRGALAGASAAQIGINFTTGDLRTVTAVGQAVRGLDNEMLSTADSAAKLAAALQGLVGPGLDAEQATDKYRATVRHLNEQLKASAGFTANTDGADKNRAATRAFMTDLTDMVTKQAEAGASASKVARTVKQARASFIQEGVAAGFSAAAMRRRANAIGLTPKLVRTVMEIVGEKQVARLTDRLKQLPTKVRTEIAANGVPKTDAAIRALQKRYNLTPRQVKTLALLRDAASPVQAKILAALRKLNGTTAKPKATLIDNASGKIQSISAQLGALNGRAAFMTATTIVRTVHPGSARGNLFAYAYGDIANRHQPELAGPGGTRVWREPETKGEAYIPLANDDRRPRARAIAAETVSLLGGVAYFAGGGINARHGGGGGGGNNAHHVNLFADALKRATASLDKEKAARDALISKRNDLTGSVRDHFLSDPFGGGSAWSPGGGSPIAVMKADIAEARAFSAQLARLKSQGLRGDALAAIASTGDIGKAAALAATGKAGVGQYATTFAQRAAAANAVGVYAGNAAYGAAIVRDNTQLVTLNATVHRLEAQMKHRHGENKKANKANAHAAGQATGKAINHAASSAHKKSRRG